MAITRPASFPADVALVLDIWRKYISTPSIGLYFKDDEAELASLPGKYAPPQGCILVAEGFVGLSGCVAFRPVSADVCEMKKLYVRPASRGSGLGRRLVAELIAKAKAASYSEVRLDVLKEFEAARQLYADLGFRAADPVSYNPIPGTQFLGLRI